jgi:hypothetical protein
MNKLERLTWEARKENEYCYTSPSQSTATMRGTQRLWSQYVLNQCNNAAFLENNGANKESPY